MSGPTDCDGQSCDDVHCDAVRDALSARLDGEPSPMDADTVDRHLASCDACAGFAERSADLHRAMRVRPAHPVPDLSAGIMAQVAPPTPARTFTRQSLAGVALALVAVSAPTLLAAPGPHVHASRHFAIYDVALAGAFAYTALRPWIARTLLPVVGTLGVLMATGAAVDTVVGGGDSLGQVNHALQFAGIAFVAVLARPARPPWQARTRVARARMARAERRRTADPMPHPVGSRPTAPRGLAALPVPPGPVAPGLRAPSRP